MIEFKCSACGKQLRVRDAAAGKRGKCPECGIIITVPQQQLVPLEADARDPTPSPPPPSGHPLGTDEAASSACEGKTENPLPIRWLNFYVYFRIPAGIVLSLPSAFTLAAFALYSDASASVLFTLLFTAFDVCLYVFLFIGLHRRRLWGWRLNWFVMVLEVLLRPVDMAENAIIYFLFLAAGALLWLLPNTIYFKKRRCLFATAQPSGKLADSGDRIPTS